MKPRSWRLWPVPRDADSPSNRQKDVVSPTKLSAFLDDLPLLKIILSSAGVVGVLIACGFITDSARDALLGVNFPTTRSAETYATDGGRFVTESISHIWFHPWISAAGLTALAAAFIVGIVFRRPWERKHVATAQVVSLLALLPLYAWKANRLDLPYMRMTGVLSRLPIDESTASDRDTLRVHDVWEKFICQHIAGSHGVIPQDLRRLFPHCMRKLSCNALSFRAIKDLFLPSAPHTCMTLEQEYVVNIYVTVLLAVLTILIIRGADPELYATHTLSTRCHHALRSLMIVIVLASSLTIPYIHGKVIRSTAFPFGRIVFDTADLVTMRPSLQDANCLIIDIDDRYVTIYRSDNYEYQHISRSRIHYVAVRSVADIVKIYANSFKSPKQNRIEEVQ